MYSNYDTNCCEESTPVDSCNNQLPSYCYPVTCCPCPCTAARRLPKLEPTNKEFACSMSARNKSINEKNETKLKKKSKRDSVSNASDNGANTSSNNASNRAANRAANNSSNNASKNSSQNASKHASNNASNNASNTASNNASKHSSNHASNNSLKNYNRVENSEDITEICRNAGVNNSFSSVCSPSGEQISPGIHSFTCHCKCTCDLADGYSGRQNYNDYNDLASIGNTLKSLSQTSFEKQFTSSINGGSILSHISNINQQIEQEERINKKNKKQSYSPKKNASAAAKQPTKRIEKPNKLNTGRQTAPPQNKQAFSTTKSCPQLDVIDEEESEEECTCAQQEQCASSRSLTQKSLEDSCADFLNIVCDNILESVQKSVDSKLKEFNIQAAEKFQVLGQKLERNETAMLCLCTDVLKKITEQNKANFQEFYSLIQDLVGSQAQQKQSDADDKESQGEKKILADEVNKCKMLSLKKTCEKLAGERNSGGGGAGVDELNDQENANLQQTDTISQIWGHCKEGPTIESSQESLPLIKYSKAQKYLAPPSFTTFSLTPSGKTSFNCQVDNSDKTKTKTNDNDNDNDNEDDNDNDVNGKSMADKVDNNNNLFDNYDTSGYATEPEDNIEGVVTNNSRKKLQKKASKQHCNNNNNNNSNNVSAQELISGGKRQSSDTSEKTACQNFKKQSRNSSNCSSPTRLSRL